MNITLTAEARAALQEILRKEEGEAGFRLREFVSGCGAACRSQVQRTLRLTISDGSEDDDLSADIDGMHFVMNELLVLSYGNSFLITLDNKIPVVNSLRLLLR